MSSCNLTPQQATTYRQGFLRLGYKAPMLYSRSETGELYFISQKGEFLLRTAVLSSLKGIAMEQ